MNVKIAIAGATLVVAQGAVAATNSNDYDVNWSVESGIGYETNVFQAPDHSYADYYADPTGATIVNPTEKSGFFVPLKAQIEAISPADKYIDMVAGYGFSGDFYLDGALSDANSTRHKLNLGAEFHLGEKGKSGKAYAGFLINNQSKVYVDRDSGDPKTSTGGTDVSNRYSYTSTGLEGSYERKLTPTGAIGVELVYEDRDYNDPVAWTQYDHKYTLLGVYWKQALQANTKLTVGLNNEVRDFSERHAYNLDGTLANAVTDPLLKYNYMSYEIGVRHRFSKQTLAFFDLDLSQRSDNHVGYNDMDQTKFKVRVLHDLDSKIRLRGKLATISRSYAKAYNFEDPTQGKKSSSGTDIEFGGEYQWSKHKTYSAELKHRIRDNSDDRYQYNNTVLMLGAKWKY